MNVIKAFNQFQLNVYQRVERKFSSLESLVFKKIRHFITFFNVPMKPLNYVTSLDRMIQFNQKKAERYASICQQITQDPEFTNLPKALQRQLTAKGVNSITQFQQFAHALRQAAVDINNNKNESEQKAKNESEQKAIKKICYKIWFDIDLKKELNDTFSIASPHFHSIQEEKIENFEQEVLATNHDLETSPQYEREPYAPYYLHKLQGIIGAKTHLQTNHPYVLSRNKKFVEVRAPVPIQGTSFFDAILATIFKFFRKIFHLEALVVYERIDPIFLRALDHCKDTGQKVLYVSHLSNHREFFNTEEEKSALLQQLQNNYRETLQLEIQGMPPSLFKAKVPEKEGMNKEQFKSLLKEHQNKGVLTGSYLERFFEKLPETFHISNQTELGHAILLYYAMERQYLKEKLEKNSNGPFIFLQPCKDFADRGGISTVVDRILEHHLNSTSRDKREIPLVLGGAFSVAARPLVPKWKQALEGFSDFAQKNLKDDNVS